MAKKMMKRIGATSAAAGIALASVLGSASAASAAPTLGEDDVWSNPTVWEQVGDDAVIDDAYFIYEQSQSAGWTRDAFDGMGYISVEVCAGEWTTINDDVDADSVVPVATEGSISFGYLFNDITNEACESDASVDVSVGLGLAGNAAAWLIAAPGAEGVRFEGLLGTNDGDFDTLVEDTQFVVSDDDGNDPSQLWTFGGADVDSTSLSYESDDEEILASAEGEVLVAAVALADYADDLGAQDEANLYLRGLAPAYVDGSGAVLPLFFGGDVLPLAPGISATAGMAFSAMVELDPSTTDFVIDSEYFDEDTQYAVQGLPEGVSLDVSYGEDGLPVFDLSGIPTQAGEFTATVWFSESDEGDPSDIQYPLPVALSIVMAPAAIAPAADDVEELAETGADPLPLAAGSVALLLIGGLALVATRRRGVRSHG